MKTNNAGFLSFTVLSFKESQVLNESSAGVFYQSSVGLILKLVVIKHRFFIEILKT